MKQIRRCLTLIGVALALIGWSAGSAAWHKGVRHGVAEPRAASVPENESVFDNVKIPAQLIGVENRRTSLLAMNLKDQFNRCAFTDGGDLITPQVVSMGEGAIQFAIATSNSFMIGLHYLVAGAIRQDNPDRVSDRVARIHSGLTKAADSGALLKVKPEYRWGGNPYNEPMFEQAITLIPLSYAMEVLVEAYGWNDPGVQKIKSWGDQIYQAANSGRDDVSKGTDRQAGKAAAFAMWGTATGNVDAFRSGYKQFRIASNRTISSDGSYRSTFIHGVNQRLYYANLTYGFLVLAADALRKAGIEEALTWGNEGASVSNGASWLMATAAQWKKQGRGDTSFFTGGKSAGSRSLGWVEVLLAAIPESPQAKIVAEHYVRRKYGGVFSAYYGGFTTCLFK